MSARKGHVIVYPRADPVALEKFDPRTKYCVMNCGPTIDDPRDEKERRFLCDDCQTVGVSHVDQTNAGAEQRDRDRLAQRIAYAVRNSQGYWTGIWNDRATAESVRDQGIHGERAVTLAVISED